MRFAVVAVCVGCSFNPGTSPTGDSALPIDTPRTPDDMMRPIDAAIIDAPPDAAKCPGYVTLVGAPSMYRIYGWSNSGSTDQSRTFTTAAATCAAQGTHLAIVDSAAEANALVAAIPVNPVSNFFWNGVTDGVAENVWLTVLGTAATYLPWGGSQPNGGTNDNCALMATNSLLYDWPCDASYPFACECE